MKIGQKLTLTFLLMALLIGAIGFISTNICENALKDAIGETSVLLARETLDKIDRVIYYRIEEFRVYSKGLVLQEMLNESNQEFSQLPDVQNYIHTQDQKWVSAPREVVTPFMQELMNSDLTRELKQKQEYFKKEHGFDLFGEAFITNKYGANVVQTNKTSDYFQADEKWWQIAKDQGLYVSDVAYDESSDVYSTDIAIRIEDAAGGFIGVMKVTLNIEEAISIIHEQDSEESQLKLLTHDGKVIYATDTFTLLEKMNVDVFSRIQNLRKKNQFYFVSRGDAADEGDELFIYADSQGYKTYKGLGWIFVIEREADQIFAPIIRLDKSLLVVSIIAIVVALLLGYVVSRTISVPIRKLMDGVAAVGEGNFDARVDVKTKNEIGALAGTFNKMAGDLGSFLEREKAFFVSEARVAAEAKKAEEVLALNQQLMASEQQLKAGNQQLKANQQLRTKEETLLNTQEELKKKLKDLELFHDVTIGREITMLDLKKEVNQLLRDAGKDPKYYEIE